MNTQDLIQESQRWLDIISAKDLTAEQKEKISTDTVDNFNFYYNRGYLEYRKSVIEMRDNPALEWAGQGSTFEDLQGRTYIDCLGGYGIYSPGIRHPKVVKAVADQLARMPLSSQELLDPLRGALAELLGEITPGDLQYSFFINNGTDAVEGAIKLARIFTGKTNFISSLRGFHGKSCGSLSLLGKWEYREPFLPLLPGIHFVEFGDAEAVEDELYKADQTGKGIAAVIMEPIQGEAGAIVPPDDF
ncbi:MAG TPA: aminotransferase class III-fold pyridoxal phosphate-dependent enzyme, partial [Thermoanaerobaculia bacterium]